METKGGFMWTRFNKSLCIALFHSSKATQQYIVDQQYTATSKFFFLQTFLCSLKFPDLIMCKNSEISPEFHLVVAKISI